MSLIPQVYSSTDAGAPALSGTVGALALLLDAILVDGYGTGGGAKSGAGWTREFTAAGKRVFRNNPVTGTGYRLRVDDTGSIGNARHAFLRAYSTMTTIDAGSDPTPTEAQYANGSLWVKSSTLDGISRAWWAVATEKWFYLFIDVGGQGIFAATPNFAGDFASIKPGDAHSFLLTHSGLTTYTGGVGVQLGRLFLYGSTLSSGISDASSIGYIGRSYTGVPGAVPVEIMQDWASGSSSRVGSGGLPFPLPVNNGLIFTPIYLREGANLPRGRLPHVFAPQHRAPFADLATQTGIEGIESVQIAPKSFQAPSAQASPGQVLIDLTSEA
jgi:hypothetical protein